MNTKISIVVPVYKVEKYLGRCVESIMNQSYHNLEIILVDDGSPDNSGEICDEYAKRDHRIKVIHQENKGLSGARNAGIDICTGEYIGFVDSDDYIHHQMYEILLNNSLKYNSEISICRILRFFGEKATPPSFSKINLQVLTPQEALKNLHGMDGQVYTVAWNKLYKRNLFDGLRYPLSKINEDEFLTYKLIDRSNQITMTDEVLYYYFQNGDSITTNEKYLINKDVFEAIEGRKDYFEKMGKYDIIPFINKAFLDRVIGRYGMLLKTGKASRTDLKEMQLLYQNYYKNEKNVVKGIGYHVFSYTPKGYFMLLNIKNAWKR